MFRLAAGNRRRDRGRGDAAVDPKADQRQPPRTEMPPLQLLDELGDQPLERLARRFGMRRRLLEPEQGSRRRSEGNGGQRFGLAPQRAVERIDRIVRLAEAAGERAPLDPGERADGLKPEPLERARSLPAAAAAPQPAGRRKLRQPVSLPQMIAGASP